MRNLLLNRRVYSICFIDLQVKLTAGKISIFESALDEPTIKGLDSKKGDYNKTTKYTATKEINCYLDIMLHKVALCKHVTLPPYTKVWIEFMTKVLDLIHTERRNSLWKGRRVRSANGIHEMIANKASEIPINSFYTVEKTLSKGMVIFYVARSLVIHLVVTGIMSAGFSESLNVIIDQATAATIR